jgi:SNF2 family DNA or RNA helicase
MGLPSDLSFMLLIESQLFKELNKLQVRRRVILSGTPIQVGYMINRWQRMLTFFHMYRMISANTTTLSTLQIQGS